MGGLDERLLIYLNRLGSERWDAFWMTVTDQHFWWWFYLLTGAYVIWRLGWRRGLTALTIFVILLTFNDQFINWLKHVTARPRPCQVEALQQTLRILKCPAQYSFFSGHAANSFLLASYLAAVLRRPRWAVAIWFGWAALLAYSRIYVGVHYPSDVLAGTIEGIVLGFFTGYLVREKVLPRIKG
ncbi:MAG: phosphatase PAP2 family protein [Chlorobi bacterium]|nr:phosphatase PAP2 family protein [Chlorobiota bacterium]